MHNSASFDHLLQDHLGICVVLWLLIAFALARFYRGISPW